MSSSAEYYNEIASSINGAEKSQMFGKPCYKLNGKAFICHFQDCSVFKLAGDAHAQAMALPGSILFDPSGKGRAMKKWVQVTFENKSTWKTFANDAADYVLESK